MGRIIGVLIAVVGLFVAQSVYDWHLSRNYTEIEAILIGHEEDCYFEKDRDRDQYFDCGLTSKIAEAGKDSNGKIERHAKLTYQYRVPSEDNVREARTQNWMVPAGKFQIGQKRKISVKNDDPAKVLWSRLVV